MRRRVAAAAAAVALAACAREAVPPGPDFAPLLERAAEARASGSGPGRALADSLYRQVLAVDPEHAEARYGLAGVSGEEGRLWEAQWHLLRLLSTRPDHAGALSGLGIVAYLQGRQEDAVAFLGRLGAERALAFEESVALADACNKTNRFAQAESVFVTVLERFPDMTPAEAGRVREGVGYARWKQGRLEDAAADLARATGEAPASPLARLLHASVLADLDRPVEAEAALPDLTFEEALQAGILADYFVLKNRLRLRRGVPEELEAGAAELERVTREVGDDEKVPHLLVRIRRKLGDLEGARVAAELHASAILALDRRDDARSENDLQDGAVREAEGDLDGALEAYRRGLEVAPDNVHLLCAVGSVLAASDRRVEAREMFARLRALPGGESVGRLFLEAGAELRWRGLARAAARRYELAAARLPGDEEPVFLRALALLEAGDREEALRVGAALERPASPTRP